MYIGHSSGTDVKADLPAPFSQQSQTVVSFFSALIQNNNVIIQHDVSLWMSSNANSVEPSIHVLIKL